jgi:sarcosine oxidase subunit alpha
VSNEYRLPTGGRIDRATEIPFTFDGEPYTGYAGDTLASALLAAGRHHVSYGIRSHRPRGIVTASVAEPCALVQVDAPVDEPMRTATTVELCPGLRAHGLTGRGRLNPDPDPARYDAMHDHPDVLVVGAGPAGLAAALTAGRAGARVVLLDEQSEPGGSLLAGPTQLDSRFAGEWLAELAALPEVRILPRTTAFGYYDDNYVVACERRTDHLGSTPPGLSRQRIWRFRAGRVVLATGAHERPLVFAGNDHPGTLLAGAAGEYLHRYAVQVGKHAVLATTNDSAYAVALELTAAGIEVGALADVRHAVPEDLARACAEAGIEVLAGHVVASTSGGDRIANAHLAPLHNGKLGTRRGFPCDTLLVSGGWNPAVHLFSQSGGTLRYDERLATFLPDEARQAVTVAGSANGETTLAACLADGAQAGADAVRGRGFSAEPSALPSVPDQPVTPAEALWLVPDPDGGEYERHVVDLTRDVTVADVRRSTTAGLRSVEHVKRHTTIGTGHEQGKLSGILTSGVVAELLGVDITDLGTTTFRPPYGPVSFAALAGRDRGALHDPIRVTAMHDWHVTAGAEFENVGQWQRPWFYPQPGEDLDAAVARECRAARNSVAMMDASTLGKIDVQGPDAGVFLDRVYTNLMSSLKVGRIRYGVLCTADGMVFDDGTVIRLASDRFLLTTTTGNAAAVLEWFEEWRQTEWPDLRVYFTSVTEHWTTTALVGPRSREVLAVVAPDLAVDNTSFPFMTWRDTEIAGVAGRVCRISFSGELAFEVNVPWRHGRRVWTALWEAGQPLGITPYGTETMHVLRAEKGYPVIGQDTDGTVTPQDLGMSWVVSKKKPDFVGKRSFTRKDTARPDRKHLVGLLPADPDLVLPEGAQLVDTTDLRPPVPMLGHVTSSYHSATLGRSFALALVTGGHDRVGESIQAVVDDLPQPVTITDTVFYDKEGARRDG